MWLTFKKNTRARFTKSSVVPPFAYMIAALVIVEERHSAPREFVFFRIALGWDYPLSCLYLGRKRAIHRLVYKQYVL
jgi:hypothetical protein